MIANFLAGLLLLSSSAALGATQTFDLAADWSDTVNPNGPWAYRSGSNELAGLECWQCQIGGWLFPQRAWAASSDDDRRCPVWFQSNGTEIVDMGWEEGDVVVHTTDPNCGSSQGLANVTWTSPSDLLVSVQGAVWSGRGERNRGSDWRLYLDEELLTQGSVWGRDEFSREQPFTFEQGSAGSTILRNLKMDSGQVLRLELEKRPESLWGYFVAVQMTIRATPLTHPETVRRVER